MVDRWMDRLSEYVDDELSVDERRELEAHLVDCADCRETLEDLRRIVSGAQALEDAPPGEDLWPGIAERIGAAPAASVVDLESRRRSSSRARRFTFSLPQLAAASVALMILSGGAAWLLSTSGSVAGPGGEPAASTPTGNVFVADESFMEYDAAVAELQQLIADRRDELDPRTVRIIEENLRVIDQAIEQARRAVAQDPASVYLNEYLAATMQQKLDFLRQAASMTQAAS